VVPKPTDQITRLGLYGGPRQLYGDFAPKTEAEPGVPDVAFPFEGTHGWGYRDAALADRNRKIFDKAKSDWDAELDVIIRRAFGDELPTSPDIAPEPLTVKARKRVTRQVYRQVKRDGLAYQLNEIGRLIQLYSAALSEQSAIELALDIQRLKMQDDEDAALAVLMLL